MYKTISSVLLTVTLAWAGHATAGPITDTVTVDGREWAQVDLFLGSAWNDIHVVCPAGLCGSGTLNGHDMAGWSWATTDDLNRLFNHYIGFEALGPGPDFWVGSEGDFTASSAFFADGWRTTTGVSLGDLTVGWASASEAIAPVIGLIDTLGFFGPVFGDLAETEGLTKLVYGESAPTGAWFFRDGETSSVASPGTPALIALGLCAIGFYRRKRQLLGQASSCARCH